MNRELEKAFIHIKYKISSKSVKYNPIYLELDLIEQALIKADKNKNILDELKTLIKVADSGSIKVISLAVLKNVLKDIL